MRIKLNYLDVHRKGHISMSIAETILLLNWIPVKCFCIVHTFLLYFYRNWFIKHLFFWVYCLFFGMQISKNHLQTFPANLDAQLVFSSKVHTSMHYLEINNKASNMHMSYPAPELGWTGLFTCHSEVLFQAVCRLKETSLHQLHVAHILKLIFTTVRARDLIFLKKA